MTALALLAGLAVGLAVLLREAEARRGEDLGGSTDGGWTPHTLTRAGRSEPAAPTGGGRTLARAPGAPFAAAGCAQRSWRGGRLALRGRAR
jgi:hypothetical protein